MTSKTISLDNFDQLSNENYTGFTISGSADAHILITGCNLIDCDLTGLPATTTFIGNNIQNCQMPQWFLDVEKISLSLGRYEVHRMNLWKPRC